MYKPQRHLTTLATLAALCGTATPGFAADGIRPLLGMSITGGGEKLASVSYDNGDTQAVRSGGLLHLFGGLEYQSGNFALQANIGYHVDDTAAKNGSVRFDRVPVELLGFWQVADSVRLGGGVRKATGAKISSSGAAAAVGSASFDGQLGVVLQGEYLFLGNKMSALLRYVAEDYQVYGQTISGNHLGLGLAYRF